MAVSKARLAQQYRFQHFHLWTCVLGEWYYLPLRETAWAESHRWNSAELSWGVGLGGVKGGGGEVTQCHGNPFFPNNRLGMGPVLSAGYQQLDTDVNCEESV